MAYCLTVTNQYLVQYWFIIYKIFNFTVNNLCNKHQQHENVFEIILSKEPTLWCHIASVHKVIIDSVNGLAHVPEPVLTKPDISSIGNKLKCNWCQNAQTFSQENAIENVVCKMLAILFRPQCVNSLWPSDTIWRQRSGSTLAQVMACCLMAPSHYLNQCWLIISKVQWHSSECNFKEIPQPSVPEISLKITYLKFCSNLPGANELNVASFTGTAVFYQPGMLQGGSVTHECSPQRAIGYYLEALLCLAPFMKTALRARLQGVTNNCIDPSVSYVEASMYMYSHWVMHTGVEENTIHTHSCCDTLQKTP